MKKVIFLIFLVAAIAIAIFVWPMDEKLPEIYSDSQNGFSVRYPDGYSVNTSYAYQFLGPGRDINGVKFTIPESYATGTNLSGYDTGVSVEIIPTDQECTATLFVWEGAAVQDITEGGIDYSFATFTDAGAGNFYEEYIWALKGTNPCLAVRYFVHSMNIGNYPEGVVVEFNKTSLLEEFDEIRHSLIIK